MAGQAAQASATAAVDTPLGPGSRNLTRWLFRNELLAPSRDSRRLQFAAAHPQRAPAARAGEGTDPKPLPEKEAAVEAAVAKQQHAAKANRF